MSKLNPIKYQDDVLILLDQRKLPSEEVYIENKSIEDAYNSIKDMVVRGAPCIGFTGIFGVALWLKNHSFDLKKCREACDYLISSRPTAINLSYEIERCFKIIKESNEGSQAYERVVTFGHEQIKASEKNNRQMAVYAQEDLEKRIGKKPYKILTHCNTGYLACGSLGTALGVIDHLADQKLIEQVWVDETRPYMQGIRLTAFGLSKLNINHKIVVEGAASYLMSNGLVDAVFVGADRIVSNGDTANKVGTSNLAILASYYNIPFYVVAPVSSFDTSLESGKEIEIEMRPPEEILKFKDYQVAPESSQAFNPSFDITEGKLITGIICEKAFIEADYKSNISKVLSNV